MTARETNSQHAVEWRGKETINTDPQRRCYNGAFISSIEAWSEWKLVCAYIDRDNAEQAAACFGRINPRRQYRVKAVA